MRTKVLLSLIIPTFIIANVSYWARIFLDPIETALPWNCPTAVWVRIDTENKYTIWTEIIFWFNPNEIKIIWMQDWWIYDMPIWSKYFDNFFYYSTTNLWRKYFKWFGNIWNLIIQSISWTRKTSIKVMSTLWKTNDSNVVWSDLKDLLTQTVDGIYTFDDTIECKTKLSDFNIFKEEDLTKLPEEDAIAYLERKIVEAKEKSDFKTTKKYLIIWWIALLLVIAATVLFIIYKKKHKNGNA